MLNDLHESVINWRSFFIKIFWVTAVLTSFVIYPLRYLPFFLGFLWLLSGEFWSGVLAMLLGVGYAHLASWFFNSLKGRV